MIHDYMFYYRHTVNLLTNMPKSSYDELLTPMTENLEPEVGDNVEYDGKNMAAIVVLLRFLDQRLNEVNYGIRLCFNVRKDDR